MKTMNLIQSTGFGFTVLAAVLFSQPAGGEVIAVAEKEETEQEHHTEANQGHDAEPHAEHENHYFAGAKGAYLYAMHENESHHHAGAGIFFELSLLPHMLEMEFSVKAMSAQKGVVVPIDILLKVPFHPLPQVNPFIGLGPAMALVIHDGASAHFGGAVVAGSYFWVHPHVALSAEMNFNLLYDHGAVYEYGAAAGVLAGW